jgi:hypothetical protein
MRAKGLIRKLSVGDLKTGIAYIVGKKMRNDSMIITEIRLDVEGSEEAGYHIYDILVSKIGSNHSRIWKSIENMPVGVELEIDEARDVEN